MSYILDALKRAAEERAAAGTILLRPSLPAPPPPRPRQFRWTVVAVALLAAGALTYTVLLAFVSAPTAPAGQEHASLPRSELRQPSTEPTATAPVPPPTPPAVSARPPVATQTLPPATATRAPVARPATATVKPAAPATPSSVPVRAERGRFRLAALAYSEVRAQRMAIINGRKYVEGELLEPGVRIEAIKEDHVLLDDQGQRLILK